MEENIQFPYLRLRDVLPNGPTLKTVVERQNMIQTRTVLWRQYKGFFIRREFNKIDNKGNTQSQAQTGQPRTSYFITAKIMFTWHTTTQNQTAARVVGELVLFILASRLQKNIISELYTPTGFSQTHALLQASETINNFCSIPTNVKDTRYYTL